MLDKTLNELGVLFDISKLPQCDIELLKRNDTLEILEQLNGLPLAFFSKESIVKMQSSKALQFVKSMSFIEEAMHDEDFYSKDVATALFETNELSDSEISINNTLTESIQRELAIDANIKNNSVYLRALSDVLVSDRYICFNASSKNHLAFRDFSFTREGKLSYTVIGPQDLVRSNFVITNYTSSESAQLLELMQAFTYLLEHNVEFINEIKFWLQDCNSIFKDKILLSNFYIPFTLSVLHKNSGLYMTRTTRYHRQELHYAANSTKMRTIVVSQQTHESSHTVHRKVHQMFNQNDPNWSAVKYALLMNFLRHRV